MAGEAPLVRQVHVDTDALAVGVARSYQAVVPFNGVVTRVQHVPSAAIAGAVTNNRVLTLTNRGPANGKATLVASRTYAAGVNAAQNTPVDLTPSGTPANLVVLEGEVLTLDSTINGTGLADPGGTVAITFTRSL